MEIIIKQKQDWAISFSYVCPKWAVEQRGRHIHNPFGSGAAVKRAVQWRVKEFCEGNKRVENVENSHLPPEADNDQPITIT